MRYRSEFTPIGWFAVLVVFMGTFILVPFDALGQVNWEKRADPLLSSDAGGGGPILLKDGIYMMWFHKRIDGIDRIYVKSAVDVGGLDWSQPGTMVHLEPGTSGEWDWKGHIPEEVIFDGNVYRMWFRGSNGTYHRLGHAWSTDGVSWTKEGDPNLIGEGVSLDVGSPGQWDDKLVYDARVVVDETLPPQDAERYRMWYVGRSFAQPGVDRLFHAASADGIAWERLYEREPAPHPTGAVLEPGPAAWDAHHLYNGEVLLDPTLPSDHPQRFKMWYAGYMASPTKGEGATGYAWSSDGINWTKHNGDGGPVVPRGQTGEWDYWQATCQNVHFDGQTYTMWYSGRAYNNGATGMGYAISTVPVPELTIDQAVVSSNEGEEVSNTGSVFDPDGDDITLSASVGSVEPNYIPGGSGDFTWAYIPADGDDSNQVVITVSDGVTPPVSKEFVLNVANVPPTIALAGDPIAYEGSPYTLTLGEVTDPGDDTVTLYTVHWGDGKHNEYGTPGPKTHTYADGLNPPETLSITVDLVDEDGEYLDVGNPVIVTVENVPPDVGLITIKVNDTIDPAPVIEVGTPIIASANFTDPGILDTHTAEWCWNWGENTDSTPGTVTEIDGSGMVEDSHTYESPGVYTVRLEVTDKDGDSGESVFEFVVVYDPDGGFVTGGGWINSPEGAYTPDNPDDPVLSGKANFGFVSKYKKGASTPTGQTEFNFRMADLNFHSDAYEWLVVAGPKAKYKGTGTVNGEGSYGFMLTGVDDAVNGGGEVDKFRIKIWDTKGTPDDESDDERLYDNQPDEDDGSYVGTELGGGNIVIHEEKKNQAAPARPELTISLMDGVDARAIPSETALFRNYPNPFNPETWLPYALSTDGNVTLRIYSIGGQLVRQLDLGHQSAGYYLDRDAAAYWDGHNGVGQQVASGPYYYQLQVGDFSAIRRMVILK